MQFIELKEKSDGRIAHIRINAIDCIVEEGEHAIVCFDTGRMHVAEPPKKILQRIKDAGLEAMRDQTKVLSALSQAATNTVLASK